MLAATRAQYKKINGSPKELDSLAMIGNAISMHLKLTLTWCILVNIM